MWSGAAFSISQPDADAVAWLDRQVLPAAGRPPEWLAGRWLAIHAGGVVDLDGWRQRHGKAMLPSKLAEGAIIAVGRLGRVFDDARAMPRFHQGWWTPPGVWELSEVAVLPRAIPCDAAAEGLLRLTEDVEEQVVERWGMLPRRVLLVDGSSMAVPIWWAQRHEPQRILGTMCAQLEGLQRFTGAVTTAIAWDDTREGCWRRDLYGDYKATRKPKPPELEALLAVLPAELAERGWPGYATPGHEADDVLAALCERFAEVGLSATVWSNDKDLLQLATGDTQVLRLGHRWDEQRFAAVWGISAAAYGDVLALAGDASDNVPGVPRIGPKGGLKLISRYGSLEEVLGHVADLKQKSHRDALTRHGDRARLSRRLVALRAELPLDVSMPA